MSTENVVLELRGVQVIFTKWQAAALNRIHERNGPCPRYLLPFEAQLPGGMYGISINAAALGLSLKRTWHPVLSECWEFDEPLPDERPAKSGCNND